MCSQPLESTSQPNNEIHDIHIMDLPIKHSPKVELIETIENPRNAHLALTLENLWVACRPGYCDQPTPLGISARRRAMSAIVHAWCSMESAVNLALYYKLRYPECPYYLKPEDRKSHDRRISDKLSQQLSFEERLMYLVDSHDCCDVISNLIGKLRQFEKLRNALVHGYSIRKELLLEEVLGSTTQYVKNNGRSHVKETTFVVGHEEMDLSDGKKYSAWLIFER